MSIASNCSRSEIFLINELKDELLSVLNDQRIHTLYQPIVKLDSGAAMGYEALTRGPAGSVLHSPLQLFKAAEQHGLLYALERLAREKAIQNVRLDAKEQLLFLNISSQIINDAEFVPGRTLEVLQKNGLGPENIVFEITERNSIEDFAVAKKILEHYRRQGYRIAIDDAGAGYSSLATIAQLYPDYIKIDRSLIHNIHLDRIKEYIVEAFITFTQKMNIDLIAEGIEQEEELTMLMSMGVKYAQGYLLARPAEIPAALPAAIHQLIRRNRNSIGL